MSENLNQYVIAASSGDADAVAKLYSRTLKTCYFLADALCDDAQSAADVTKTAYAKAFGNIDKLKKPEAFEIWMKQNIAAVYKDSQKFVFADADAGAGVVENAAEFLPESVLENKETADRIYAAVKTLKPELRAAFVLYYNNGMPVPVLAKFFGVSESTANALLGKARANVIAAAEVEGEGVVNGNLPVITRLFQNKASEIAIDNAVVRDIFIFAIDAFDAAKPEVQDEAPFEQISEETAVEEAEAEETVNAETADESTVDAEEEKTEESQLPDNVLMFRQKINSVYGADDSEDSVDISSGEQQDSWHNDEDEGLSVPEFSSDSATDAAVSDFGGFSFDNSQPEYTEESSAAEQEPEKKKVKINVNPKIIGIAVAVVALLLVVIISISKIAGNNKPAEGDAGYAFQAGGFAECTEIAYLDENAAYFKSVTTGKYGLMDYQGNVILQPNYDAFKRCGSGREYTDRDSYHTLVTIGNEDFEVQISNGVVTISENAHLYHSVPTEALEDVSYDERDRYFEGYAAARKNDKWGYVSQEKDKKVIPYEYEAVNDLTPGETSSCDYCRPVTDGLIAVKKDGKMGIINLKNDVVVPFEYSNIMPGSDGVFIACKEGVWGVILVGEAQTTFKGVNIVVETLPPEVTETPGEETLGKYKVVSDDGANIRDGAGSDYDLVGELDTGDVVIGYSTKKADNGNKWLRIKFNGEYGWVAMSMLEPVE